VLQKFCFYDHLILFQSISVSEALSQLLSFTNSFNLLFNISHTLSCFRICICLLHHGRKSFHNISTLWIAVLFTSSMPSVGVFYYDEQVRRSHDVRKDDMARALTWAGTRTLSDNNYQCSILVHRSSHHVVSTPHGFTGFEPTKLNISPRRARSSTHEIEYGRTNDPQCFNHLLALDGCTPV
jgi:hypothetical protein